METIIEDTEIKTFDDGNKCLIVRFKIFGNLRFTYLTDKSLKYWADKGVITIEKGMKISVMERFQADKKQYKITKFN